MKRYRYRNPYIDAVQYLGPEFVDDPGHVPTDCPDFIIWIHDMDHSGKLCPCIRHPSGLAASRVIPGSWIVRTGDQTFFYTDADFHKLFRPAIES